MTTPPRPAAIGAQQSDDGATRQAAPTPARKGGGLDSLIGEVDRYLFNEGRHFRLYDVLGAHPLGARDGGGWHFAIWAPNATAVSVIHDHNAWVPGRDPLEPQGTSGLWSGVVHGVNVGTRYKFAIETAHGTREKADPLAFATETPPRTASVLTRLDHAWHDEDFIARRPVIQSREAPISIYEVHLGSFRRHEDGRHLSYRELAGPLIDHVCALGFTHIELLPVMEHPFYGSWGYQTSSFFAPTSRYGAPEELMALIDACHQAGIGVLLDWVPSHFATDAFALGELDGTHLYEHADERRRIHPDWGSYEFNYGRHEVRAFLISSACFWIDRYHADGLRVDAVASMLYLDYSRDPGTWSPNEQGGNEDLSALSFLRELNDAVHERFGGVLTVAEESTAWPGVTAPTERGGLGFSLKWDMGWMHDTLTHFARDPVHGRFHYDELTFRSLYANSEAYVLPLSHDEVVHGKGALATKMPGDDWQRRANLRLLIGYQWLLPGKKLLMMGSELATWKEWDHESELEWFLLEHFDHAGVARFVADCNRQYRALRALHERDLEPDGFAWVEAGAREDGVLAFLRFASDAPAVLCALNLTPVPRSWRFGVPEAGRWLERLNSDAERYGGSNMMHPEGIEAAGPSWAGQPYSLEVLLPPLAVLALAPARAGA